MKFSQSLDLALHALWYMARHSPNMPVMVKDLAENVCASESYLARVMLWLAKAGIVRSIRGKKGGFVFKINPDQITIADIVIAIDKDVAEYACPCEARECAHEGTCSLVQLFHEAQHQMLNVLKQMTIADIANAHELGTRPHSKEMAKETTGKKNEEVIQIDARKAKNQILL